MKAQDAFVTGTDYEDGLVSFLKKTNAAFITEYKVHESGFNSQLSCSVIRKKTEFAEGYRVETLILSYL